MLLNPKITAFIPTTDPKKAKDFYLNTLGLNLVSEDHYALEFEGNGAALRITTVQNFEPYPFTILGFKVKEIASQVHGLTDKGITFESYPSFEQDDLGIWTAPSNAKIAWFKDPDGNLISLTEYPS